MNLNEQIDRLGDLLAESERVLVTTHYHPDGDAIGSSLALRRIFRAAGKEAAVVIDDVVPEKYEFLLDDPIWQVEGSALDRVAGLAPFDLVVFVDASDRERVGKVLDHLEKWTTADAPVVNIDHHIGNEEFGEVVILDGARASSGEIVLRIARRLGLPVDSAAATQLYAAVLTDTGRFQFSNTDPEALRAAADLIEEGADPTDIAERIYFERPSGFFRLLGRLFTGMELHGNGRICVLTMQESTARDFAKDGPMDTEGIVDFTVQINGVELGAFIREVGPGAWRASLRSRGRHDVRGVAESFGGGGHEKAAGCRLEGTMQEAKDALVAAMEQLLA